MKIGFKAKKFEFKEDDKNFIEEEEEKYSNEKMKE